MDREFSLLAIAIADLKNAGVGEIFSWLLVQKFLGKLASLNFRVGQGVRRLRRRAKGGKENWGYGKQSKVPQGLPENSPAFQRRE